MSLIKKFREWRDRRQQRAYFAPENENENTRRVFLSPSEKYKLITASYSTKQGCWCYTKGEVYLTDEKKPIAVIERNYSSFPFLFVEGHPSGHDYLVCGADYQGQTVIELDTGRRRDELSKGAEKGHGFCWVDYQYSLFNKILVVNGCHWACPFEYRFFDFANPMDGWPEIEPKEAIFSDGAWPRSPEPGVFECFTERSEGDIQDEEEGDEGKKRESIIDEIRVFKREGLVLKLVRTWTSDWLQERRVKQKEAKEKWDAWVKEFTSTDPLYLLHMELVKDPALAPQAYFGYGKTYQGWGGSWSGEETRFCHRIFQRDQRGDVKGPTVDLEWAVKTGPIKLQLFRDGKHVEDRFFEHALDGMRQAHEVAKEFIARG